MGGEKRAWYTLLAHAHFPRDSGNLENVLCYTNLHEAHRLLLYKRCLPLIMLYVEDDEEATKVLSSLLAGVVHAVVPFQFNSAARE